MRSVVLVNLAHIGGLTRDRLMLRQYSMLVVIGPLWLRTAWILWQYKSEGQRAKEWHDIYKVLNPHPTDSARGLVESSDTNTWQANLWSAGCFVMKPKYLRGKHTNHTWVKKEEESTGVRGAKPQREPGSGSKMQILQWKSDYFFSISSTACAMTLPKSTFLFEYSDWHNLIQVQVLTCCS